MAAEFARERNPNRVFGRFSWEQDKTANPLPFVMEKISVGVNGYKTFWDDESNFFIHIEPQPIPDASSYRGALLRVLDYHHFVEPTVFVSGGLDSELAAVAVHEYGAPYTLTHMEFRYAGHLINSHERYWTERLAKKLGKELNILTLNVDRFYSQNQYLDWAIPYKCRSPQLAAHNWALGQISVPVILGGNLVQGPNLSSTHYSCYRVWQIKQRQGIEILQDSFELFQLSQTLPKVFTQDRNRSVIGKHKHFIYNSWGFHHEFEDRPKYTGFELIHQQYLSQGRNWNREYRTDTLEKLLPALVTQFV